MRLFLTQSLHRRHRRRLTLFILDHLGLRSSYLVFTHVGCSRVRGENGDIVRIDVAHSHYEGGRHPKKQSEPTANKRRAVSCLRGKTHARAPPQLSHANKESQRKSLATPMWRCS
jgi:hypothetical protein